MGKLKGKKIVESLSKAKLADAIGNQSWYGSGLWLKSLCSMYTSPSWTQHRDLSQIITYHIDKSVQNAINHFLKMRRCRHYFSGLKRKIPAQTVSGEWKKKKITQAVKFLKWHFFFASIHFDARQGFNSRQHCLLKDINSQYMSNYLVLSMRNRAKFNDAYSTLTCWKRS